jgi:hypothetical protein
LTRKSDLTQMTPRSVWGVPVNLTFWLTRNTRKIVKFYKIGSRIDGSSEAHVSTDRPIREEQDRQARKKLKWKYVERIDYIRRLRWHKLFEPDLDRLLK